MRSPWQELPRLTPPVTLLDPPPHSHDVLDTLFDLPVGSAFSLAKINPHHGGLTAWRWRDTGNVGFYPASTIKWITGALIASWMDSHGLEADDVLALEGTPPRPLRDLMLDMLTLSDNEAFNTLQETLGFAETHAALQGWGIQHSLIRRHFTRPHWTHSRPTRVMRQGKTILNLPPRPAAHIPLNPDPRPAPLGNPESNYFTTDDLLRVAAATLMGPTRYTRHFDLFTQGLSWTNRCHARDGLTRLTASLPDTPAFVVLNKPGWWPDDGANADLCYIFDVNRGEHFLLGAYVQGSEEEAQVAMSMAAESTFAAIHAGKLTPAAE